MSAFLAPTFGAGYQSFTNAGVVNSGGFIFTYIAGSTTAQATWTNSTQVVQNANPITLDSSGRPPNEIWLQSGIVYKFIVQDANSNILGTYDNISGINDNTGATSEWIASGFTPTYIGATQFSVAGNQTSVFTVNRRVQASVSAGIVYGTISASAFSSVTTVTLTMDSGEALDSGLSVVNVSILNPANPSVSNGGIAFPETSYSGTFAGVSGNITATVHTTQVANGVLLDLPAMTGTSTSSGKTLTGLGTSWYPARTKNWVTPVSNNSGATAAGLTVLGTNGTITFYPDMTGTSTWVGTGVVTIGPSQTSYTLA